MGAVDSRAKGHARSGGSARRPPSPPRSAHGRARGAAGRPELETRLRILDGPSAGTEYAIAGSVVRLGRADDNDIVLPDSNASRNHAELVRDPSGKYVVRDLGSRNGILVNRRKVPQALLSNGDRITIGSTSVEFMTGDAPPSSGAAKRWLAVAAAAGLLGFALVTFGGGSEEVTGPVVVLGDGTPALPDAGASPTPPPVITEDGISMTSLFATSRTVPPGGKKGTEVARNEPTKVATGGLDLKLPTSGSTEAMIAAIMQEGDRAYDSGKLVDARAYYDRAVKLDPNCERCVNRYDLVDRQIKKEVADAMQAGVTYMETQRWDQAIREFEKVQFLEPDAASVNNANATAYIDVAKQKKASGGR